MTPPSAPDRSAAAAKADLRAGLLRSRRNRPAADRDAAAAANVRHLLDALRGHRTIAAFVPLPTEPLGADLLDQLVARGQRVLVPVVTGSAPLDWVAYPSPVRPGPRGIAEPLGPRLHAAAIRDVDVVLVPALAVDRAGRRLGRGGGHYDRTLALVPDAAPPRRIAVLFDGELLDELPADAHDRPVHAVVTPGRGVRPVR